jgi:4-amino-4-deoxy-L-arabinose transferase-like glycosyltransferase
MPARAEVARDSDDDASGSSRTFRIRLALITAGAALWRLGYLFAVKIDDALLLNDSLYYSIQAGRNSEGDWFREGLTDLPGAEHGPLTSLYLTPWSIGGGDNVGRQRFAITLLGIITVALVGVLGRRLAGARVGLAAAAIAAVYPNLWINDSLVMSESLAIVLVTLALIVALHVHDHPSWRGGLGLGVLVGLAALTRSELALLAPAFAGLLWWRTGAAGTAPGAPARSRWIPPAVLLAASLVTVAPWLTYNLTRFEEPVLMSTNDGTTLLGANCDRTYYDDLGGWDIRCLDPVPTDEEADGSVRSAARRELAVEYVGEHLERLPIVVVARLGRIVDVYGWESLVALDVGEEKAEWAVWAGMVMWWLLAALAVAGWWRLRADDRSARWWLLAVPATVVVATVLFYGAHRIRAPAEPVVVVLAATGLLALAGRIGRGSHDGPTDGRSAAAST